MTPSIDLNADLGEGEAHDGDIMQIVTSCNIACGGHTGDTESMKTALRLAQLNQVAAGAHPSYPDREGFGRQTIEISATDLTNALVKQVDALKANAADLGIPLTHLKPHGALYNEAAKDAGLAAMVAQVAASCLPGAYLVGPPGSQLEKAAQHHALTFVGEGFADRAYTNKGALVSRTQTGAVIGDPDARTAQAMQIAQNQAVTSVDGVQVQLPAQTICLHGDSAGALASARAIRAALETAGIALRRPQ